MRIGKAFRHLVQHVLQLGPLTGLRVLWLKKRAPGHRAVISTPALAGPLTIRTGTSDLSIFDEVVLLDGYGFPMERAPRTILDIGANIGMATLWFKQRYPDARIIAVEPDADNFAMLKLNVAHLPGVEVLQAALASADGVVGFETEGLRHSAFHIREHRNGEQGVEAISVGSLLRRFDLDGADLVKLDIEGGEKELFEAADLGWMDRVDTLAVELHDRMRPGCGHAFFTATARSKRNYEVHAYLVIATKA